MILIQKIKSLYKLQALIYLHKISHN